MSTPILAVSYPYMNWLKKFVYFKAKAQGQHIYFCHPAPPSSSPPDPFPLPSILPPAPLPSNPHWDRPTPTHLYPYLHHVFKVRPPREGEAWLEPSRGGDWTPSPVLKKTHLLRSDQPSRCSQPRRRAKATLSLSLALSCLHRPPARSEPCSESNLPLGAHR